MTSTIEERLKLLGINLLEVNPHAADSASNLIVDIFGECGKHIITSLGANSLPSQTTVGIDAIFEIEK